MQLVHQQAMNFQLNEILAHILFKNPSSLLIVETWEVQNWKFWATNTTKTWRVWNDGFIIISKGKGWASDSINDAVVASQATMAVGFAASLASPQGAWSMVNQFQILMLMPLTDSYFPSDIVLFLTGMEFSLFSFNFIPFQNFPFVNDFLNLFHFEQPDEYIYGKF